MFTERSVDAMTCDDDGYDVEEMQSSVRDNEGNAGVEEVPDENDQQDADQETNGADPMNEDQDTDNDKKQHQDEQQPALISLAVSIVEVSSSFAQSIASGDSPEISSRTMSVAPREINASSTASPSSKATSLHSPELRRIVTFDVGGKLFRCKESLIRKYPLKRLNQVITCGCEQIHGDTFFIDRNPQHFEIVLDWYRTGTYIWHPLVNEAALKEDAKCFDVYNDLFPQRDAPKASTLAPPVPARSQRRLLPQAASSKPSTDDYLNVSTSEESPSRSAASHQSHLQHPATQVKTVHDHSKDKKITTRFSKIELWKVVWSGVPVVHMVRHHEQLVVASVKGHGMLLVRVCDATGVQTVHVDHAVLFDSQSRFYLQGGRAKLQHCVLPGGFTYTFWMELVPDFVARATAPGCSSDGDRQTNGAGDNDINGPLPRVSVDQMQLDVEFKLLASFQGDEKLADSVGDELQCLAGTRGEFGEQAKPTLESFKDETTQAFSPFLFLPPRHKGHSPASPLHELQPQQHSATLSFKRSNFVEAVSDRDEVAKQIFAPSTLLSHADLNRQLSLHHKLASLAMKTGRASIVGANTHLLVDQVSPSPSVIKRNGASIVLGSQQRHGRDLYKNNNSLGGKITVYKQAQLTVDDSPREISSTKRNFKNARHEVKAETGSPGFTKRQDHKPHLFR